MSKEQKTTRQSERDLDLMAEERKQAQHRIDAKIVRQATESLKGNSEAAKGDQQPADKAAAEVKFADAKEQLKSLAKASAEDAIYLGKVRPWPDGREGGRREADPKAKDFANKIKGMKFRLKD